MANPAPHFTSDQHALATGGIFGLLAMESGREDAVIDRVLPELDRDGNYKPMLTVELYGRRFRVIIAEVE